jgi:hypothetical protein
LSTLIPLALIRLFQFKHEIAASQGLKNCRRPC